MATENKVQFNLKNVYYAKMLTSGADPTWAPPVHVPGAVTLSLTPQGEVTPFYADGIVYYQTVSNNGYSGDLEMARFPDQMMQDIWGLKLNEADGVLTEYSNVEAATFALLYQIDGDADNQLYCMYNCSATRPDPGSSTTTETKEPKTQSCTISAVPLEDNRTMSRTTHNTPPAVRENWFKQVYAPAAPTVQEE